MNKEILEQAITKAIAGGWDVDLETVLPEMTKRYSLYGLQYSGPSSLLFNHDFAKALWGEDRFAKAREGVYDGNWIISTEEAEESTDETWLQIIPLWQYHLQAMVIADDPIQYLGDNLPLDNHKKYMVQL